EAERVEAATGIDNAHYTVFEGTGGEEEVIADAPAVVAEMSVDIPSASVSDAVMMLDLRNTNALLFVNSGTSAFNMVYRRNDGTIGWVEPPRERACGAARTGHADPVRAALCHAGASPRP